MVVVRDERTYEELLKEVNEVQQLRNLYNRGPDTIVKHIPINNKPKSKPNRRLWQFELEEAILKR
jgi:hypothetical protein